MRASARTVARKGSGGTRTAYLTHRVRKGQTLSDIARKHGVSLASLRSANGLGRRSTIRAGQTIRVPVSANEA